jgi:hypothetical protein
LVETKLLVSNSVETKFSRVTFALKLQTSSASHTIKSLFYQFYKFEMYILLSSVNCCINLNLDNKLFRTMLEELNMQYVTLLLNS